MKNLQLSLKRKWFEMTKAGIKIEDYRNINEYWVILNGELNMKKCILSLNTGNQLIHTDCKMYISKKKPRNRTPEIRR